MSKEKQEAAYRAETAATYLYSSVRKISMSDAKNTSIKRIVVTVSILGLLSLNIIQYLNQNKESADIKAGYKEVIKAANEEVIEAFHQKFYNDKNTWFKNKWMGIKTEQNPNDIWITQEIIFEVKPDYIIETGTLNGGSAVLWAMILEHVNPEGKVITIDIEDKSEEARHLPIAKRKVEFIISSSTDPDLIQSLKERVSGKEVLVILDSWHVEHHVYKELIGYADMVSLGSYMIAQDTNVNGHPVRRNHGPGPMEAVEKFLKENDQFEIDKSKERLLFTMHPNGYLKKVK